MKTITLAALTKMLTEFRGASFITLTTSTTPKLNQRHRDTRALNPYLGKKVQRTATRHVMIGASYEQAVINRRESEGHTAPESFKAEALWNGAGRLVEGSKVLVQHQGSGKTYLVFYPYSGASISQDVWSVDGTEVSQDDLAPYLPPVSKGAPRQETQEAVVWRTVELSNIVTITMNQETYLLTR